jgi:hypothetical protein
MKQLCAIQGGWWALLYICSLRFVSLSHSVDGESAATVVETLRTGGRWLESRAKKSFQHPSFCESG